MEIITTNKIQSKIYTIRGVRVMLDRDLASLYEVETKVLTKQLKGILIGFLVILCFSFQKMSLKIGGHNL